MKSRRTPAVSPLPVWAGGLGALALCFLFLPLAFMLGRVNWASLGATLATPEARDALGLSLRTCAAALGVDLLLGVPAALVLSRSWRGVRAARILVALPLSLPPVVAGIALLAAFGRRSTLGALLSGAGLDIAFTTTAVVIAQVFVSLPFLIVTLESALRAREQGLDEMASSLGASPSRVFWQITLPTVLPGLGRGAALALARCLGEFGATLTFAGSMQGVTRTMPLQIYLARESDADLALALGVVLLGVAAAVVALTETPWGRLAFFLRFTRRGPASASAAPSARTPEASAALAGEAGAGVAVRVAGTVEARGWDVDAELRPGLVTAVVGHNGAGKSTLAQVIAGTLRVDSGAVSIGEQVVDDAATFVPARRRGVAMVSQAPRIFTHMSVLSNVAFPLRVRGVGRAQARAAALEQLRAVGIADLAFKRASDLSGGQAARVLASPASVFAARLAGLNIVSGPSVARPGMVGVRVGAGVLWAADSVGPGEESARVALTFPPEAVALSREEAHASPRSVLPGAVAGIDVDGSLLSVRVALAEGVSVTARVTAAAWSELGLGVGDHLWASVKATQVRAIRVAVGS